MLRSPQQTKTTQTHDLQQVTIDVKYTGKAPGVISKVLINAADLVKVGQQVRA